MFSKGNKENQETQVQNNPQIDDLILSNPETPETNYSSISSASNNDDSETEQPQLVKLVEKISGILSPYFIVIVGLYLYDDNFLFGTVLIIVGIMSLLKISYQDIKQWIEQIKGFFNNKDS